MNSFTHMHYFYDYGLVLGQLLKEGGRVKWSPGFHSWEESGQRFSAGPCLEDSPLPHVPAWEEPMELTHSRHIMDASACPVLF